MFWALCLQHLPGRQAARHCKIEMPGGLTDEVSSRPAANGREKNANMSVYYTKWGIVAG
jgi:hypothetical protein